MAVTLAIFAAVQVAVPLWARPHLIPPDRTTATIESAQGTFNEGGDTITITASVVPGQPGAWIISSGAVNAAGQPVSTVPAACVTPRPATGTPGGLPPRGGLGHCLDSQGIREAVTYQPASRYWALQWIETGIFLAIALALAGFCFWRLGRRTS
jgi:hypothetical protein